MRGSTKKLIHEWAIKSWEATPEKDRVQFGTLSFYRKIKKWMEVK